MLNNIDEFFPVLENKVEISTSEVDEEINEIPTSLKGPTHSMTVECKKEGI